MRYEELTANYSYVGLCIFDKDGTGLFINQVAAIICNYSIEFFAEFR